MKKFYTLSLVIIVFFLLGISAFGQAKRIAVLPFQNMDGNYKFNYICFKLQDSVSNALAALDTKEEFYHIVPADSVELLLTELNVDPQNPQYPSDVWKAIKKLNVKYVVSGTFIPKTDFIIVNAYIYNAKTKIPSSQYQIRDIFKEESKILESVTDMKATLLEGLKELK